MPITQTGRLSARRSRYARSLVLPSRQYTSSQSRNEIHFPSGETAGELSHVEIEPLVVVEPRGRALTAGRMERHQVSAAVSLAEATRQGADDFLLLVVIDPAVAAEDPDRALS
jgi:hypothetical protein